LIALLVVFLLGEPFGAGFRFTRESHMVVCSLLLRGLTGDASSFSAGKRTLLILVMIPSVLFQLEE
jgi:hypothetical protein